MMRYDRMTDAELEAEIDELARDVASFPLFFTPCHFCSALACR